MSAAAGAASSFDVGGGVRLFSGDSEDAPEYKRWKVWAQIKLLTSYHQQPEVLTSTPYLLAKLWNV